ncbi:squalene/phytoene synthase family protein [Dyella sp.]|uniref:squalene/phytoene synthase family protein n=1 Tax=Dyella sp. TaxID=1869338 RepID=UPI002ED20FA2
MNASATSGEHAALDSYVEKWLAVQPQQRIALAFVDPSRYPGHVALAALEQELLGAAYGIREPHVAATKLNWWAEELTSAPASGGRHPLTQVLFDDDRATTLGTERWLAPVLAAMAQLEEGTAADFPAQLAAASQLHGAWASLETAWWFGVDARADRAARVATLSHLLHGLLRLEEDADRDRLPLPMARLARHGLSRPQLRQPGSEREAAIKAQLNDLREAWRQARALPGPLSVFRSVESNQNHLAAHKAFKSPESLVALRKAQQRRGPAVAWQAWRAARAWQRGL